MNKKRKLAIIHALSQAGSAIVEIYNSNNFEAQLKSDNSPVTKADMASSKIINAELKKLFPDIPVLDEENNIPGYEIRKNWTNYFLLDPLDGTKEFIKQNGEFCINLARIEKNVPVEGWVYQPLEEKGWYCKKGEGIVVFDKNGYTAPVKKQEKNSKSLRIVTSRSFFKPLEAKIIEKIEKDYPVELIHFGSTLKQVAIILGNADMYLKAGPCSEWDTAPGQLMVEEFGGAVLRQDNFEKMNYNKPNLLNPFFIMLSSKLNHVPFKNFLKKVIYDCGK